MNPNGGQGAGFTRVRILRQGAGVERGLGAISHQEAFKGGLFIRLSLCVFPRQLPMAMDLLPIFGIGAIRAGAVKA
jgi:hypothetical protein